MRSPRTFPQRIDRWIQATKWVAAGLAVACFPFILHAVGLRIRELAQYPLYSTMFLAGAGLVVILCRTDYVHAAWVRSAIAIERRFTQGLFSRLFLAPRGRWLGKGNWVILATPYFLPVASLFMWLASWILYPSLRSFVLGLGVAYHIASVIIQWKAGTKESRRLGKWFAILFLVPANLFVIGAGYGFALNGFAGLFQFTRDVFQPILDGIHIGLSSAMPSLATNLFASSWHSRTFTEVVCHRWCTNDDRRCCVACDLLSSRSVHG